MAHDTDNWYLRESWDLWGKTMLSIKSPVALAAATLALGLMVVGSDASAQSRAVEISGAAVNTAHNQITDFGKRAGAPDSRVHIFPTTTARFTLPTAVLNRANFHGLDLSKADLSSPADVAKLGGVPPLAPAAAFPAPGSWSPADLSISGGAVVTTTTHHPIYINCKGVDTCWVTTKGDIPKFISKLNTSTMITITNQYVGSTAANRYPLGKTFGYNKTFTKSPWGTPTMLDSVAQAIAQAASATGGTGYNHMYHIFVPKGTDVCFDSGYTACYSPDHGSTFYFCGYHGSFTHNGQKIVYSVEPYDHVSGCFMSGQSVTDAQVSVLSHEIFEAITDPDPNSGWNNNSLGEIGDECAWRLYAVNLSATKYNIQLEYSNKSHLCKAVP